MINILQTIYFWDKFEKATKKRNYALGNFLVLFLTQEIFSIILLMTAKSLEDLYSKVEKNFFIALLEYVTSHPWFGLLLFLLLSSINIFLSLFIANISFKEFKELIRELWLDIKPFTNWQKIHFLSNDFFKLVLYSIIVFIPAEIFTLTFSMFFLMILSGVFLSSSLWVSNLLLILFIGHIITFPFIMLLYHKIVDRKLTAKESIDLSELFDEDGEIIYSKWKEQSWMGSFEGAYDWNEEQDEPRVCPSCGSIISIKKNICPICRTDVEEELEKISKKSEGSKQNNKINEEEEL